MQGLQFACGPRTWVDLNNGSPTDIPEYDDYDRTGKEVDNSNQSQPNPSPRPGGPPCRLDLIWPPQWSTYITVDLRGDWGASDLLDGIEV